MRIAGIVQESIVDGPGIRLTIFSQGCRHNCLGCHNPDTHSFSGGEEIKIEEVLEKIKENPLLDGVTFSGGDPFEQAGEFAVLGEMIKEFYPELNIITYTGYLYEDILKSDNEDWIRLLEASDFLIDGPFKIEEKTLELRFRGSRNQRIIDVKKGKEVEFE